MQQDTFTILMFVIAISLNVAIVKHEIDRTRRNIARADRKLSLILEHLNIGFDEFETLSDRVKELAGDPSQRIEAIKAYRKETKAGLPEAKEAIDTFIKSIQR